MSLGVVDLEALKKLVAEDKAKRIREAAEKRLSYKARLVAVELGRRVFKTHGNYYIYIRLKPLWRNASTIPGMSVEPTWS